jgi:hypothetical protein
MQGWNWKKKDQNKRTSNMDGMPKILLKKHLGPQTLKITQIIHLGSFI